MEYEYYAHDCIHRIAVAMLGCDTVNRACFELWLCLVNKDVLLSRLCKHRTIHPSFLM